MSFLLFQNISKSYDNKKLILNDISFEISEGEFVILLGPSGCGKTTLLRLIAGLEEITNGKIIFNGKILNDIEPKNRNISMVFQNYALYPHLNVFDNIAFPLKIKKINKNIIKNEVNQLLNILELNDYKDKLPKELSGGQRQRVALGRALIKNPDLFLFDEPLSNLDAKLRVQMRTEIIKFQKSTGKTSIYVTHDQLEAMTMGDRIVILNNGIIQQIGSPFEVYNNPKNLFVASFIGTPQINMFQLDELINYNSINNFINNQSLNNLEHICIRPEKIQIEKKRNQLELNVIFERSEYIGNEYFIYFRLLNSNNTYILRTNNQLNLPSQTQISIYFNPEDLLFF